MTVQHHGGERDQSELMKRFINQADGKMKRSYPNGRISAEDEGELVFVVSGDPDAESVRLNFGKPVHWLEMTAQDAVNLAQSLIKQARGISKEPINIVIE